jgi:hypothetical protein
MGLTQIMRDIEAKILAKQQAEQQAAQQTSGGQTTATPPINPTTTFPVNYNVPETPPAPSGAKTPTGPTKEEIEAAKKNPAANKRPVWVLPAMIGGGVIIVGTIIYFIVRKK